MIGATRNRFLIAGLLFLFTLALYSVGLNSRPFFTKGEAREAVVVLEMRETGNYVLPLRNGEEVPSKPPLFHWAAIFFSKVFGGVSEFSVRFPSAFSVALMAAATFLFFARAPALGFATVLVLLTSLEVSRNAVHARVDMCFSVLVVIATQALFNFYEARYKSLRRELQWLFVAMIAGAGAVLTKGPAGLLFPWTIFGVYVFARNRLSFAESLKSFRVLPCIATILLTIGAAGVWYWTAYQQQGEAFLQVQLLKENAARIFSIDGQRVGHSKPFFFSGIYLLSGFLPWSLFLPVVLGSVWHKRKYLCDEENKLMLFSLIWVAVFLLVVSVAQSKRSVYLLPAFPAISYLTVLTLRDLAERRTRLKSTLALSKILFWCLALAVVVSALALVGVFFLGAPRLVLAPVSAQVLMLATSLFSSTLLTVSVFLLLVTVVLSAVYLQRGRFTAATKSLVCAALLTILLGNAWAFSLFSKVAPEVQLIAALSQIDPRLKLVQYRDTFYPLVFYHGGDIRMLKSAKELTMLRDESVVVSQKHFSELTSWLPEYTISAEAKAYVLDEEDRLFVLSPPKPGVQATALGLK